MIMMAVYHLDVCQRGVQNAPGHGSEWYDIDLVFNAFHFHPLLPDPEKHKAVIGN